MFNSPILDFSISLIFLFLQFSLFTSWIMQDLIVEEGRGWTMKDVQANTLMKKTGK